MSRAAARGGGLPGDRLEVGDHIRYAGATFTVADVQGPHLSLLPHQDGAAAMRALLAAVVAADDFAVLSRTGQPLPRTRLSCRVGVFESLPKQVRKEALRWEGHVKEVLHEQAPHVPATTVPPPQYDPARRTLQQRCQTKAEQLTAAGVATSWHTVERKCRAWRGGGAMALVDRRQTRAASPHGRVDERVVEALWQVLAKESGRSAGTVTRLHQQLEKAMGKRYRKEMQDPDERKRLTVPLSTFYQLLHRLGLDARDLTGSTARRTAAADRPRHVYTPMLAQEPGQLVIIDSTGLDLLLLGDDARPTPVELTIAIDVATRSIIGEMLVPKRSGTRVPGSNRSGGRATRGWDAVRVLTQALAPVPSRPGWSPLTFAEGSDLPYEQLLESDPAMTAAAARPVIRPSLVVVDHGSVFTGDDFAHACNELGIEVRHARTGTGADKGICERAHLRIKTGFSQHLPGYTGRHRDQRGKHVEREPLLTINEALDRLGQWIALEWQQTPHEGLRSIYTPGLVLSPNQMYAEMVALTGHQALPLTARENRKILPAHWVTVTRKGFQINNRVYTCDKLNAFYGPSGHPGHPKKWEAHLDPYRPEVAWLFNHRADEQRGEDPWLEVPFVFRRLLNDPWNEEMWQQATAVHVARGGNRRDQAAIARAVNELFSQAWRRPARNTPAPAPGPAAFPGQPTPVEAPRIDPYANIPDIDPATIEAYPSLNVPAADLFAPARSAAENPAAAPELRELLEALPQLTWDVSELDPGPEGGPSSGGQDSEEGPS